MAGHSKWKNIQGRKNAQDAKRGRIFQKLSRELYVAAKAGGTDPSTNASLRLVMDKAKAANMPNENIDRALKKATNSGNTEHYDEVVYEGYGPGGIAVLVYALTDNRNRTATNVRVAFSKNGGSLGETGSVSYMFDRKGYIVIERNFLTISDEEMLKKILDVEAEELETLPEVFEIYTAPEDFWRVKEVLANNFQLAQAKVIMVPKTVITVTDEQQEKLQRMINILEDDDDISEIFTSVES